MCWLVCEHVFVNGCDLKRMALSFMLGAVARVGAVEIDSLRCKVGLK